MKISSWVLTGACPTYSASLRGRMARSTASSSVPAPPLMIRSAVTALGLLPRRALQRASDQLLGRIRARLDRLQQARRLGRAIAERDEGAVSLALGTLPGGTRGPARRRRRRRQPVAHLDDEPLG